jgi:hypothetical protein
MNKRRLFLRILASPVILQLLIITYLFGCIRHFIEYLKYGGEWIRYVDNEYKCINDIYKLLKEQLKNNEKIQNNK